MELRERILQEQNLSHEPERWVDEYGDYLYRYALPRVRNSDLAEDLVQETFLAALKARHDFAGQSSEKTWLVGILKHKIVDHFRKISRECALDEEKALPYEKENLFRTAGEWVDHWKEETSPGEYSGRPDSVMEQKEFWKIVERSIRTLPPRLAEVFMLREVEELSTEEICEKLNISAANLWVMLHRARMQLRRSLESTWLKQKSRSSGANVRSA